MNHKQQIKIMQSKIQEQNKIAYAKDMVLTNMIIMFLLLADKFGFRKPRLKNLVKEFINIQECYVVSDDNGDKINTDDIKESLKKDYDFDFDKEFLKFIK